MIAGKLACVLYIMRLFLVLLIIGGEACFFVSGAWYAGLARQGEPKTITESGGKTSGSLLENSCPAF